MTNDDECDFPWLTGFWSPGLETDDYQPQHDGVSQQATIETHRHTRASPMGAKAEAVKKNDPTDDIHSSVYDDKMPNARLTYRKPLIKIEAIVAIKAVQVGNRTIDLTLLNVTNQEMLDVLNGLDGGWDLTLTRREK